MRYSTSFLVIVLCGLVAACARIEPAAILATRAPTPQASSSPPATATPSTIAAQINPAIPNCPADIAAPLFDTVPMALDDFIAFRPLGWLSPPLHVFPAKHSAFSVTLPGQPSIARPIVAPGKIWVAEIWQASFSTGGANYQVFLYPCRDVRVYVGHIAALSDKLLAEFKRGEPKCNSFYDATATVTTCRRENLALALESGEPLGTGPDTQGVDFGVTDFRRAPAAFVNVGHYDYYYPYYASPLDYFTPAVKQSLASKTGHVFGNQQRTAEPIGGTHMQDIAGTAQGNWFAPGVYHRTSADLSSALALVHDLVDPAQPIFSIGNSVPGLRLGLYSFKATSAGRVNRDFADVKADGMIYCYNDFLAGQSAGGAPLGNLRGIILLTMPTAATLKIEWQDASRCDPNASYTVTANATLFER